MKARVSHLHRTEVEWIKLKEWIPEAGELVVYDPDSQHDYARLKIGDGTKPLKELPFFIDSTVNTILHQTRHQDFIDGGRITMYKD